MPDTSAPPPGPPPGGSREPVDDPHRPVPEPQLPRGCNPLTFGVVMATIEMAIFLGLWLRCR